MKLCDNIKSMVKSVDLFSSSQMLRYDEENQYQTYTGGLISLALIITIFVGFANMIIETLNLSSISYNLTVTKQSDPPAMSIYANQNSKFMFGIQIAGANLSSGIRYYDMKMELIIGQAISETLVTIDMGPCTKQHWKFLPEMVDKFDQLDASTWLCPDINQLFTISGKYSSSVWRYLQASVLKCNQTLDPLRPCANTSQLQNFLDNQGFANGNAYFTLYFSNPIINAGQKQYIGYYLEDTNYVIFGNGTGSEVYIYLADYTIESDQSIWPFQNVNEQTGFISFEKGQYHPFSPNGDLLLYMCFAKSTSSLKYERQVQKISSVFSFIGGLISAFSTALFIIKMYTDTSLEITIGLNVFSPQDDDKQKDKPTQFNFLLYMKFHLYGIFKKFKKIFWQDMHYIQQCQSEIIKQLDVKRLVKRIIFIQSCLTYMLEDYQLEAMQVPKIFTPSSAKALRKKFNCFQEGQESQDEEKDQDIVKSMNGEVISIMSPKDHQHIIDHKNKVMNDFIDDDNSPKKRKLTIVRPIGEIDSILEENKGESQTFEFIQSRYNGVKKKTIRNLQKSVHEGDNISKKIYQKINVQAKKRRDSRFVQMKQSNSSAGFDKKHQQKFS